VIFFEMIGAVIKGITAPGYRSAGCEYPYNVLRGSYGFTDGDGF